MSHGGVFEQFQLQASQNSGTSSLPLRRIPPRLTLSVANTLIGPPFMLSGDRFASFVCPDCSVKFTTLSHLQTHWLREHHRCQREQQTTQLLQTTSASAEQADCGHGWDTFLPALRKIERRVSVRPQRARAAVESTFWGGFGEAYDRRCVLGKEAGEAMWRPRRPV
ncbi:hypothetical protein HPB50_016544 [Hyalomma asiaticum]|uniref:Uncharacterized protein n=1 Tax=Hyalomma asiaticum TaxID=266040 RepID=A0ACB7SX87_HYAAI|nr:hypothetical protein HPB50_016544 [Hyalomma asiaticum]